ncbi:hypothetical protein [Niallia endozanthoxylica]|uniref:Uncharacterized protein n=1 Tax=Niallia endozanthoxylica TaxID=2036016 RepID=A0A5J5H7W5_9BACI|nr:hypothetical protein [Niallia endozanthoxylica]KAA9015494.1 hypothetical protein F4V44_22840 [Niallia endozanthoxylica]
METVVGKPLRYFFLFILFHFISYALNPTSTLLLLLRYSSIAYSLFATPKKARRNSSAELLNTIIYFIQTLDEYRRILPTHLI